MTNTPDNTPGNTTTGADAPLIRWMFHSTAMVPDYDLAVDRLALLAGLRVLEYSENHTPEIGRRGGMCWVGDNSIELGQPIVSTGGAARFVERTGGGLHSVAVQIHDVDAAMAHAVACGAPIAAQPTPEMFFTDPRRTDGVFIEWATFEVHEDPHFGADPPDFTVEPLLDVEHHAFVGAIVDDPASTADYMARLFGTQVTFHHPDAGPGSPSHGVSVGDCTLALYPMPGDDSERLWGRRYERPRCHLLGLTVDDLDAATDALAGSVFDVHRLDDGFAVIDPASTGMVQVALVDRLLPGDPRHG